MVQRAHQIDPHVQLDRSRLYVWPQPTLSAHATPRIILFIGLPGSGKTVASQGYLQQVQHTAVTLELRAGKQHGWATVRPALEALGLPTARPQSALKLLTTPTVICVDQLEHALNPDGTFDAQLNMWLPTLLHHPWLNVVLVSRVHPVAPALTDLVIRRHVHTVDSGALAFTVDETQALWRQRNGTDLDPEHAEHLVRQSAGLASAISLACSTGSLHIVEEGDSSFAIATQVLAQLPPDLRDLLIDSAAWDTLTPHLIDHITGRRDGTFVLERLRQHGLIRGQPPSMVHPLINNAALQQLRRDPRRLERAIDTVITHGMEQHHVERAWELATAEGCWHLGRSVILHAAEHMRGAGASHTLLAWIEQLPPVFRDHDVIVLLARCQSDIGDLDGAELTIRSTRAATTDLYQHRELSVWLAAIKHARGDAEAAALLVVPYLNDPSVPSITQARIFRLYAIACAQAGDGARAWAWIQRSVAAAYEANDRRLLALAYGNQATIAGQLGRLADAEHALRLAERCWRDLGSLPDLAVTLNARAMWKLGQHDYGAAFNFAQESRACALAGGRLRAAAVASATCGDIVFAQGHLAEARQHYLVAAEDSDASGAVGVRTYAWAMQAHVARLRGDRDAAALLLPRLWHQPIDGSEYTGWRISGVVAAQLTLGLPPLVAALEEALAALGAELEDVQAALLAMDAHAYSSLGDTDAAEDRWQRLRQSVVTRHGHGLSRLAPLIAGAPPSRQSADHLDTPFVLADVFPANDAADATLSRHIAPMGTEAQLSMRVFGGSQQLRWQRAAVDIPDHGWVLLLALMTATGPVQEDTLLRALWKDEHVTPHALRKLIGRIHAVMPGIVRRTERQYMLTLARHDLDVDLLHFWDLDPHMAATEHLVAAAEQADSGCLRHHSEPWADQLRQQVRRRSATLWLEIAQRAERDGHQLAAHDAYERAHTADPVSDFVTRAVMKHAEQRGDRALVMERYRRYRQALDLELGVDPATDIEAHYRQALEP